MATNPFAPTPEQQAEYDKLWGVSPQKQRERAQLKISQKEAAGEEVTAEDYASLFKDYKFIPPTPKPTPTPLPTYNPNTFSLDIPEGFDPSGVEGYDQRGLDVNPEALAEWDRLNPYDPVVRESKSHIFTGGRAQNYQQANDPSTIDGMWREDSTLDPHFQTNFIQQELTGLSDYLQQFTWGENQKAGFDPQWLETGIPKGGTAPADAYDTQDAVYAKSNHRQFNDLLKHQGAQSKFLEGLVAPASALAKSLGVEWTAPTFAAGKVEDNVGLFEGMQSLQELFGTIDETRAPNVQKAIDLDTPNLKQIVSDTYTKVFGDDADEFMGDGGPDYWFNELLNDPNKSIPVGGSMPEYLEEAFKNDPSYKTYAAAKLPTPMTDAEIFGLDEGEPGPEDPNYIVPGPEENPFDDPAFDDGLFDGAPTPPWNPPDGAPVSPFGGGGGGDTPAGGYGGGNQGGGGSPTIINNYGSNTSDWSDMFNTLSQDQEKWQDQFSNTFGSRLDDLKTHFGDFTRSNESLIDRFREDQTQWQADQRAYQQRRDEADANRRYQEAAYGEKTANREVKGVKTLKELPGYTPKSGGARSHFNRGGSRLKTSSLNVA